MVETAARVYEIFLTPDGHTSLSRLAPSINPLLVILIAKPDDSICHTMFKTVKTAGVDQRPFVIEHLSIWRTISYDSPKILAPLVLGPTFSNEGYLFHTSNEKSTMS